MRQAFDSIIDKRSAPHNACGALLYASKACCWRRKEQKRFAALAFVAVVAIFAGSIGHNSAGFSAF